MKNRYRIVRDTYSGYEAQVLVGYWPFRCWRQLSGGGYGLGANTRGTVEESRALIALHKERAGHRPPRPPAVEVVEYID